MNMSPRLSAGLVAFALVTLAGFDPGIGGGRAGAAEVLFVGSTAPPTSSDQAVIDRLTTVLGHNVTVVTGPGSTTGDALGKQLVVVSSSVASGDVNTKFRDVTAGVLNWEQALWDDFQLATAGGGNPAAQTDIIIRPEGEGHPLAAGLAQGTHTVYSSPQTMSAGGVTLGPSAIRIADTVTSLPAIVGYEKDGLLANGAPAAGRRVGFYFENTALDAANPAGVALFDAAVGWAVIPEPGAMGLAVLGMAAVTLRRRRVCGR
jgi:MYXO-CTERM domain-containing protein